MLGILLQSTVVPASSSSDSLSLGPLIHAAIILVVAICGSFGVLVAGFGLMVWVLHRERGKRLMVGGAVMIAAAVLIIPVGTLIGSYAQYGGTSLVNALSHLEPQGTVGNPAPAPAAATSPAPAPTTTPACPPGWFCLPVSAPTPTPAGH